MNIRFDDSDFLQNQGNSTFHMIIVIYVINRTEEIKANFYLTECCIICCLIVSPRCVTFQLDQSGLEKLTFNAVNTTQPFATDSNYINLINIKISSLFVKDIDRYCEI